MLRPLGPIDDGGEGIATGGTISFGPEPTSISPYEPAVITQEEESELTATVPAAEEPGPSISYDPEPIGVEPVEPIIEIPTAEEILKEYFSSFGWQIRLDRYLKGVVDLGLPEVYRDILLQHFAEIEAAEAAAAAAEPVTSIVTTKPTGTPIAIKPIAAFPRPDLTSVEDESLEDVLLEDNFLPPGYVPPEEPPIIYTPPEFIPPEEPPVISVPPEVTPEKEIPWMWIALGVGALFLLKK